MDATAEPMHRVRLLTKPITGDCVLGVNELHEMITMLAEFPDTVARPSKLRAVFAMRACRKSVMIGTPLSRTQMRKVRCGVK